MIQTPNFKFSRLSHLDKVQGFKGIIESWIEEWEKASKLFPIQWKRIGRKLSDRCKHLSQLKPSAFFSLQKK